MNYVQKWKNNLHVQCATLSEVLKISLKQQNRPQFSLLSAANVTTHSLSVFSFPMLHTHVSALQSPSPFRNSFVTAAINHQKQPPQQYSTTWENTCSQQLDKVAKATTTTKKRERKLLLFYVNQPSFVYKVQIRTAIITRVCDLLTFTVGFHSGLVFLFHSIIT